VRHVEGENPLRVIIDPRRLLAAERRVFAADAPTLLVYGDDAPCARALGEAEIVALPLRAGRLNLGALLAELGERGCRAVLVEGGGPTVVGGDVLFDCDLRAPTGAPPTAASGELTRVVYGLACRCRVRVRA